MMQPDPAGPAPGTSPLPDDELRDLLRFADPWDALPGATAVAVRLAATTGSPAASDRLGRRRVITSAATIGAVVALAAAGVIPDAWTGMFAAGTPDGTMTVNGITSQAADGTDTSQLIDPQAAGGRDVVRGLAPREMSLPDWVTWDDIADQVLASVDADDAAGRRWGVMSENGFRSTYVHVAESAWQISWLGATAAGDDAAAADALVHWRAATDENAWVWDPQQRHLPYERLAAAEAGDVAVVQREVALNAGSWLTALGCDVVVPGACDAR